MKRKEVEDVLGGKDSWKNVDKTVGPSDIYALTRSQEVLLIFLG
jgi:hypothetical protein